MKRILLIIFLTTLGAIGQKVMAQNKVVYMGEVRDSLGAPLEFANVMAMDTVKNTIASFGVTNQQGQFRLSLVEGTTYQLKVSFIGFLPFEGYFKAKSTVDLPVLITLSSDVTNLGAVEVVTEMPVLIQGDTITYKADVFTQGNERKLQDVLKDLPGFEVDENGEVSVQGKKVDKLLVEGKEFFEGDTKLATKNLPANVVDKVQVLQNFNNVAPLSGVNNSEQLALNIQLKDNKKNMVFGDLTAGAGPEERFLAHANVFYYDPKTNINLIADANNVGELAFSMSDYFRFTGGLGGFASRSGSNFQVSSNQMGIPMAERNNAKSLNNQLGALNYNFTPSKKIQFTGFAIGSKVDNDMGSVSQRKYVLQSGENNELLTSESNVKSTSGLFKFGTKYAPNLSLQIDYSAFLSASDIQNSDLQNSLFNGTSNDINSITNQTPISIDQQLRAFYAPDAKNVFSFEGAYKYSQQDPAYNLLTTQRPFASIIPLNGDSPYNLIQLKEVTTHQQEAALNYYRILNKTNHINFKVGLSTSSQEMTSGMLEKLSDGSTTSIDEGDLSNLVDYTFNDYYFGVFYKTKWGNLTVSPGLNLHFYDIANSQNGNDESFNKTLLLPSFNAKYSFRSSHTLNLTYNTAAQFTDIQNIAQGIMVRGYNSLFAGNPALENSWYHSANLNYSNFNMYNFLNIYGGLSYQKRFDDVSNIIDYNGLERINTPINIDFANESLTGFASIDKRFDHFRAALSGNWNRSVTNNRISDVANENVSFMQSYKATISSTLFKAFNLDLGYEVSFNNYKGRSTNSKFENHKPFAKLNVSFLKGFRVDADYEFNQYLNNASNTESNYDLLNAELSYRKEGSKWEFRAKGMNLMNTTGIRRDSFSESLISTYEYYIQKRYFLFSVMFDL